MFARATAGSPSYMAVSKDDVEATNHETGKDEEQAGSSGDEESAQEHFFTELPIGTATVSKTIFNLTSFVLGASFLALPYALATGGLVVLLPFVLIPAVDFYTAKLLVECLYENDRLLGNNFRVRSTYRDIGIASFAKVGGLWVDTVVYTSLLTNMMNSFTLGGVLISLLVHVVSLGVKRVSILIVALVILPTAFMKDLANIAWLSLVSFGAVFFTVLTIMAFSLDSFQDWTSSRFFFSGTVQEVANAFAIVFFCFESHTVLPDVEESMADRSKINHAMGATYAFSALLTIPFALLAFMAFGKETQATLVQNIPSGFVSAAVDIFLLVSVMLSLPVAFHATMHSLQYSITWSYGKSPTRLWFLAVRIATFFLIVLVSVLLPYYAGIAALAGSLAVPHTTIICPCVFHLKLKYKESGRLQIIANVFLVLLGIISQVVTLYFSVRNLLTLWELQ